ITGKIKIEGRTTLTTAVVADIAQAGILGVEYMLTSGAVINFNKLEMSFDDGEMTERHLVQDEQTQRMNTTSLNAPKKQKQPSSDRASLPLPMQRSKKNERRVTFTEVLKQNKKAAFDKNVDAEGSDLEEEEAKKPRVMAREQHKEENSTGSDPPYPFAPRVCQLMADEDIPPYSSKLLKVHIAPTEEASQMGIIESVLPDALESDEVEVVTSLTEARDGIALIKLRNCSAHPVRLEMGTILGVFSSVENLVSHLEEPPEAVNRISEKREPVDKEPMAGQLKNCPLIEEQGERNPALSTKPRKRRGKHSRSQFRPRTCERNKPANEYARKRILHREGYLRSSSHQWYYPAKSSPCKRNYPSKNSSYKEHPPKSSMHQKTSPIGAPPWSIPKSASKTQKDQEPLRADKLFL
ncbi:unnamed protein product, partial [Owenia fusiformis]